jgi:hypothetical protein
MDLNPLAAPALMIDGHEGRRERKICEGAHRDGDQSGLSINSIVDGCTAIGAEAVGHAAAVVANPREFCRSSTD